MRIFLCVPLRVGELDSMGAQKVEVADLATNIAEDAVYLAEGKTIKHRFEERVVTATA